MPAPMIAVITGGTLAHIRPHLALCAPAYGQVGSAIAARLRAAPALAGWVIHRIPTRMAGRPSAATRRALAALGCPASPETNADVAALLRGLLVAPALRAVVMAAAICDFEPEWLVVRGEDGAEERSAVFGKSAPRLHHARAATVALRPSEKLLTMVKALRPDVALVSFKTTAGQSVEEMAARAIQNLRAAGSDVVLANDVHTRRNLLAYADGTCQLAPSRSAAVALLCAALVGWHGRVIKRLVRLYGFSGLGVLVVKRPSCLRVFVVFPPPCALPSGRIVDRNGRSSYHRAIHCAENDKESLVWRGC